MNKYDESDNPNTSPEVLEQLATDRCSFVRLLVAGNPNTPPKTLELLVTDWHSSVRSAAAQNPNTDRKSVV
jgi:hypothetical protein